MSRKTILGLLSSGNGKYRQNAKSGWRQSLFLILPSRNKNLVVTLKNYKETDIKVF